MPSTLGIVASGLSTPLQFSPSLWLDASDTSTITASGSPAKVSQWNDKSGNGRNVVQAFSASQPVTNSRTVNSLNVIDFDATRLFASASTSVVSPTDGTFSVFAVAASDTVSGIQAIFNGDSVAGARPPQFLRLNGTTIESIRVANFAGSNATVTASLASATSASTPTLFRTVLTTSLQVAANGTTGSAASATGGATASPTTFEIASINAGSILNGVIAEIIVYPYALTALQIASVESYLTAKWGL